MSELAERIARLASTKARRVAVAESLTGGALSSALAAAPDAQEWYAGGVVAYQVATKRRLLGVEAGIDPCSAACASQMASGARSLLAADVSVSVTGVGGPEPDGEHLPGTVYIGVGLDDGTLWWMHRFIGNPAEVIEQTVEQALVHLADVLD